MKTYQTVKLLLLVASIVALTACAIGNKYRYHDVVADIDVQSKSSFAVTVYDQRAYVLNGRKSPNFVGLQRGGWGNPFNVGTASGKPLSIDMATAIKNSLQKKGHTATAVFVSFRRNQNEVLQELMSTKANRLLLLTLLEWKSDTYNRVALIFDVNLEVYNAQGDLLAQKSLYGRDNLGSSAFNSPRHAKRAVPVAFKNKIEELLNSDEIKRALR